MGGVGMCRGRGGIVGCGPHGRGRVRVLARAAGGASAARVRMGLRGRVAGRFGMGVGRVRVDGTPLATGCVRRACRAHADGAGSEDAHEDFAGISGGFPGLPRVAFRNDVHFYPVNDLVMWRGAWAAPLSCEMGVRMGAESVRTHRDMRLCVPRMGPSCRRCSLFDLPAPPSRTKLRVLEKQSDGSSSYEACRKQGRTS